MTTKDNQTWTRLLATVVFATVLGAPASARAATVVLDGGSGADYDSVGDGWFFTSPPNQPPDGVGDLGGNALAVALQTGTVELRAMSEFPLSPLSGLTSGNIQSATLTFTIDDVIGTFGPGTTFDGTASDPIVVYGYPADGTVAVSDFDPAGLEHISTKTIGVITDASLGVSGPVAFTVDVTAVLKDYLDGGETAIGILMGTGDSPTGTSLDGVLPFITVETKEIAPPEPPVLSKAEQKCQAALSSAPGLVSSRLQKALATCLGKVLKAVGSGDGPSAAASTCDKSINPANAKSAVTKTLGKASDAIAKACEGIAPAALGSPCDAGAENIGEIASCLIDEHHALAQQMVRLENAAACPLLTAVGYDEDYPGVCAP